MAGIWDSIIDRVAEGILEKADIGDMMQKAGSGATAGRDGVIGGQVPPEATPEEMIGLMYDPFALLETMGYRERYSAISYEVLLKMAYSVPIYPSILQTRRSQIVNFSTPELDRAMPGFSIGMRDVKKQPSKKEAIRCREVEEWVVNTGASQALVRDGFDEFLKKFVRDAFIYDQPCFEIVNNKKGQPCDFYCLDGASIRIADTAWRSGAQKDTDIRYVQVHDETVIAEFAPINLCMGVRNPRSDLRVNGYGESELEMGIKIATALINGFSHNSQFFKNGTVSKGMLNLPKIPDKKLRIFSRQFHMIASGVLNAWRTPITNFEGAEWIDMQKSNRDMEWVEFVNFCIKLFSGICQIDPEELHFSFGNAGQNAAMIGGTPAEHRVKQSKDKGLRPLLKFIASCLNRYLIWRLDPDLCLRFTGLDPREGETTVEIEKKQVTYLKTVNELRAENDLPKLPPKKGDLILDAQWMQAHMAAEQAEQMEQQGGMGGEEGGPPGEGGQPGEGDQGDEPGGPDMGEDDWAAMMDQAAGTAQKALTPDSGEGEQLRKSRLVAPGTARVTEMRGTETVVYDIDLGEV